MLSKKRILIISLVAAFSVAGLAAVPAGAARNICTGAGTSTLKCRPAKGCTLEIKLPTGATWIDRYEDGETETLSGHRYKCNDGKWVRISSSGAVRPEGPPRSSAPEGVSTTPINGLKPVGPPPPVRY
jgi:hypothetical protein